MQYSLLTITFSLITLLSATIISSNTRSSSILRLPLTAGGRVGRSSKRQESSDIDNNQHGTRYYVDVSIGTPKQSTTLLLDTGSYNTWVNPQCSTAGSTSLIKQCKSIPRFKWKDSTTLVNEHIPMNQTYNIGWAQGTFVTDNFYIGNIKITNHEIGVASQSSRQPVGVLGISPPIGGTGNPTFIDNLVSQGVIKSRAFSISLGDVDSPVGSIIFGGLDTKKYNGSLEKLPIIPPTQAPDGKDRYWVYMNSVGITKPGQKYKKYSSSSNPQGQPIVFDTGSTISSLPSILVHAIVADFPGATHISSNDLYQVNCKFASQDGTVDFGFGDTVIQVPYNQFIWQPTARSCYLGVRINEKVALLGDTFLRSAYVVYDQDNRNLHVAQGVNCGTNLVEIGKGPNAVPSIVGKCNKRPTSTTASKTSSTSPSSKTISSTSSSGDPIQPTGTGISTPAPPSTGSAGKAAINLAAVVIVAHAAVVIF